MLLRWMGRAGPVVIPAPFAEGCPPPSPAPAEQGFGMCIFAPCQQRSDDYFFFFPFWLKLLVHGGLRYQDPLFSLPHLGGLEQSRFSTQTEVLYKNLPCSSVFQVRQFPLSQVCAREDAQRDMNLFSALLKLQHCPQIILTQRQCSSVHQPAHFALSKDTFPCME